MLFGEKAKKDVKMNAGPEPKKAGIEDRNKCGEVPRELARVAEWLRCFPPKETVDPRVGLTKGSKCLYNAQLVSLYRLSSRDGFNLNLTWLGFRFLVFARLGF